MRDLVAVGARHRRAERDASACRAARFPRHGDARTAGAGAGGMDDFNLVLALFEPDIAANTGAMLRTCACFGAAAAIVEPAGFVFDDKRFRRAGMDYLDALRLDRHVS